jgi:hypothetical protein
MTNPLSLIRKLDASPSTPPTTPQQRQNSRRERRAALKTTVKSAKTNAQK